MRARGPRVPLALLLLAMASADPRAGWGAEIVDSAGRRVAVPQPVERVFAAGPPAAIVLYTLAPGKLLGWTRAPSPAETVYLAEPYRDLPAHGRLTGRGDTASFESVLTLDPDLIVDLGSVGPTYADLADRVSRQTGIPALLVGGRLAELPAAYRLLGRVLDAEARADRLARYVEAVLEEVRERIAAIPDPERPRYYYARGPEGLDTALSGGSNAEAMDLVGARNVAGKATGRRGLATVSLEQVIHWNPEIILTIEPDFARDVRDDPRWETVTAVASGRVHLAPQWPFPWIDFPPSVNRVIGLRWLAGLLYPEAFPEPLEEVTREFYELFYMRQLTDDELERLLHPLR